MGGAGAGGTLLLGVLHPLVGGIGSSIFSAGANAALNAVAHWVASGSAWLLGQIGAALGATTQVSLSAPWFVTRFRSMEGLFALFALPLLLVSALQALFQQRASILLRAALVQLPLAAILAGAAVELTSMALAATDELSSAVASSGTDELGSLTGSLANVLVQSTTATGTPIPTFITMLCAAVVAVAALVLWVELVLRAAAIYVVVLFLPLALACSIWPALSSWCRRLVETLAALILSKLIVVVVLVAAVGALGDQAGRGFSTIVTGIALLVLATFAPFTLLKLLPLFEATAALQLEGLRQRGTAAVVHGPPRQAAAMALDHLGSSAPLAAPAAMAALGAGAAALGSHATSQLDQVGHRSTEDPMEHSAVRRSSGSEATSDLASPSVSEESTPQRVTGSSGAPRGSALGPDVLAAQPEQGPPTVPSRAASTMVVERDALGPVIRPRPQPQPGTLDGE
jgi:hypothetical protein